MEEGYAFDEIERDGNSTHIYLEWVKGGPIEVSEDDSFRCPRMSFNSLHYKSTIRSIINIDL